MMCSLDVTCMVNIPFKNGLSTKKRQETTTDFAENSEFKPFE